MAQILVAHLPGCFELGLVSLRIKFMAADLGKFRVIFFFISKNSILCVLIRIASSRRS